eukprot:5756901-Amphidinium_carterae.1
MHVFTPFGVGMAVLSGGHCSCHGALSNTVCTCHSLPHVTCGFKNATSICSDRHNPDQPSVQSFGKQSVRSPDSDATREQRVQSWCKCKTDENRPLPARHYLKMRKSTVLRMMDAPITAHKISVDTLARGCAIQALSKPGDDALFVHPERVLRRPLAMFGVRLTLLFVNL